MTAEDVKKIIKECGYWEVVFTPRVFNSELISDRTTCKQLLEKNSVQLRGWDYPHIPKADMEYQKIYLGTDHCEAFIDWGDYKEVLRFYQSGQFIHYFALREDWMNVDKLSEIVSGCDPHKDTKPGSVLSFVGATYSLTEIYEFLRRLTSGSNIYDNGVRVVIKLHGAQGRKLVSLDASRIDLFWSYVSNIPEITLPEKELTKDEVLNSSKELALQAVRYLFETFGWENMPMQVFEKDQQNLLERRF